jgi:hypothetical protein
LFIEILVIEFELTPGNPNLERIVEIPIAVIKKTPTDTNDLMLNLGSPQSPCPLVHPFCIFAPNPTRNPERANPKYVNPYAISSLGPNGIGELGLA